MKIGPRGVGSVRVLLVDESSLALHGLKAALSKQNRIIVAGTACSEVDAQAALQTCQPNVVVLETVIGCTSGISLCKTIRESYPNVGVLFFTAKDDAHLLRSAIAAGAQGYLLKTASCEALLKSIETVAGGRAVIDPGLTHQVLTWVREGTRVAPHWSMADSSVEDLRLLSYVSSGKTNREIAQELNVEQSLIAARLRRLYKRLRITRRAEVVSRLLTYEREPFPEHGWIERSAVAPIRYGAFTRTTDITEQRAVERETMRRRVVSVR